MEYTRLSHLSDDELLRHVDNCRDPIMTTEAEIELAERFGKLLEEREAFAEFASVIEDYEVKAAELRTLCESHPQTMLAMAEMLAVLSDHDIHTAGELKRLIERADKFRALASDAGDIFTRLNNLITETQE